MITFDRTPKTQITLRVAEHVAKLRKEGYDRITVSSWSPSLKEECVYKDMNGLVFPAILRLNSETFIVTKKIGNAARMECDSITFTLVHDENVFGDCFV